MDRSKIGEWWIVRRLWSYGWVCPYMASDEMRLICKDEDFDVLLSPVRRGEFSIPDTITILDISGNGISYHSCEVSIRRTLAGRLSRRLSRWIYAKKKL